MRIGVIGLGIVGSRMAANWVKAGHAVTAWNRTRPATPPPGVTLADCPREVASLCDVIMIVVADPPALQRVVEGPDGIASAPLAGRVVMNASTVGPADNQRAEAAVRKAGGEFLETPFTGSKAAAEAGKLVFFVGGAPGLLQRMEPLLLQIGHKLFPFGDVGRAADAKLIFNLMIANVMQAMAEGFTFARKAGLDLDGFVAAFKVNAAYSGLADLKIPKMLSGDFSPHFALKHMDKDLRLAMERATELQLDLPQTRRLKEAYSAAMAQGWGEDDFAVLYRQVAAKSGL
jgi:3-hydroxyisobutyrate dehydrogenase-like beta-hydroxyacid dehydrogenase